MLRDGALSDDGVIDLVNSRFVPVWVNIRTTPVPDVPSLDPVLTGVPMDERRNVGILAQGFFLRSIILSPDALTLLNPEWGGSSLLKLLINGHFAYAQVRTNDYLEMLGDALKRLEERP